MSISTRPPEDITQLLQALNAGEQSALNQLMPRIYHELKQIARRQLSREHSDHTLNTTALVHEAYIRLIDVNRIEWASRAHFFAIAARMMRRILIDYAVQRRAQKRGGDQVHVPLEEAALLPDGQSRELLELDDALQRLEAIDARHARVVEYRIFGGMSIEETAEALDISPATVKRDWNMARAWLNRELSA